MRLRYHCHFAHLTGYSRAAHDYLQALHEYEDWEIDIRPIGGVGGDLEPRYSGLEELLAEPVWPADVGIYHTTPKALSVMADAAPENEKKRVALTTWETSRMPDDYRETLRRFDAVIVPSEFVWRAIDLNDLVPVYVIPHCFDPEFWEPTRLTHDRRGEPFHFYSIGAWGERKNVLGLIHAYFHEFTKADDVGLYLVVAGADFDTVRSLIARSGLSADMLPALQIPPARLSERELLDFHAGGDCFVSATRGEGFGLGHFEAAIMGKKVITPGHGGFVDFLDDYEWTHYVEYQMTPCFGSEVRGEIVKQDHGYVQTSRVAIPPGVNCKQTWADPDLVELGKKMRAVYEERPFAYKTAESRFRLERIYGYESVARLLSDKLKEIASG
jgi:glycosyltransferase involved in cell wall biosynthesis